MKTKTTIIYVDTKPAPPFTASVLYVEMIDGQLTLTCNYGKASLIRPVIIPEGTRLQIIGQIESIAIKKG